MRGDDGKELRAYELDTGVRTDHQRRRDGALARHVDGDLAGAPGSEGIE